MCAGASGSGVCSKSEVTSNVHCEEPGAKVGDWSREGIKLLRCYGIVQTIEGSEKGRVSSPPAVPESLIDLLFVLLTCLPAGLLTCLNPPSSLQGLG